MACLFGKYHNIQWRNKGKNKGGSIRNPSDKKPGAMTSAEQMISNQLGIVPSVTRLLIHTRFWESTVFLDHFSGY